MACHRLRGMVRVRRWSWVMSHRTGVGMGMRRRSRLWDRLRADTLDTSFPLSRGHFLPGITSLDTVSSRGLRWWRRRTMVVISTLS